jgi:hypothetical protein
VGARLCLVWCIGYPAYCNNGIGLAGVVVDRFDCYLVDVCKSAECSSKRASTYRRKDPFEEYTE